MPGNNGLSTRLDKIQAGAPPVDPLAALHRNLLYAMLGGVTAEDMQAVIAAQVEKAKAGNDKAARLLVGMLQAFAVPPGPVQMVNVNVGPSTPGTMTELRRSAVTLIAAEGPQTVKDIAQEFGVPQVKAQKALQHEWFDLEPDGWHVTAKARADVLEGDDPPE